MRGFGSRWTNSIKALLESSEASVLVNKTQSGYVRYRRGLRQGDLLTSLFFCP